MQLRSNISSSISDNVPKNFLTSSFALLSLFIICFFPYTAHAGIVDFTETTTATLDGSGVTLEILSGSDADSVTVDLTTLTVVVDGGDSFTVRSLGNVKLVNDGGYSECTLVSGSPEVTVSGPDTVIFTPSGTCPAASSGGGGGGGGGSSGGLTAKLISPNGGEVLTAGSTTNITWSTTGSGIEDVTISYSLDNGFNWITIIEGTDNDGSYSWLVPNVATTKGLIKIDLRNDTGTVIKSDESADNFSIVVGTTGVDPSSSGVYIPAEATAATTNISVDKGLSVATGTVSCSAHSLIRASLPTVYYCGTDGKRYGFPNEKTYFTWYSDFSKVVTISDAQLASIPLAGNVTYRPGVRLVKIASDPKTYAVSRGGLLRWVESEAIAISLYGSTWNKFIDDVPDVFFTNYKVGISISELDVDELVSAPTPTVPAIPSGDCTRSITFTQYLTLESVDLEVRPLQELLQCLGYFPADVKPSGYFGPTTEQAVKDFQSVNGIEPAGYVGPSTRTALNVYPFE